MESALTFPRAPKGFTCLFTSPYQQGWDIYEDETGTLWSLSKDNPDRDSMYGKHLHLLDELSFPSFSLLPTEDGGRRFEGAVVLLPPDYFLRVEHYKKMRALNKRFPVTISKTDYTVTTRH
ncbi:MAG: hypothetical protein CBC55_02195 [Gammaproteobacteria bacterium TMED95]|nr:MAG: hypothetical protein CBC55_02195 [Gammaproteobacteria bacterium TMED95]|tara:strand:- start:29 stop:391 length:363 start_codon:yes stop_codon:yes gene_type:complete